MTSSRLTAGFSLFLKDVLQDPLVERQIRDELLELFVFVLELTNAAQLGDAHALVDALPVIEGRLGHAELAANFLDGGAGFDLAKGVSDLLLSELRSPHRTAPIGETSDAMHPAQSQSEIWGGRHKQEREPRF